MSRLTCKVAMIFCFQLFSLSLYSQGMNNNYLIDSVDIKNIISMLGIEVFKYPLLKQSEDYKLRIIQEDYINHKLVTKSFQTDGLPSQDMMLNKDTNILRLYKKGINDSTIQITFHYNHITLDVINQFDNVSFGLQQCRAYSDFQPVEGKTKPIFIWYANKKGKSDSIHCPGNSPIHTVAELYDYVICISIDLVEAK